mmetsp:Transcript_40304/g.65324  ORF Transcript_40304/g.65324 Transcript_40304/m.65324 type:complete len:249 (-) Transcript_40304:1016-1762(-)
MRGMGDVLTHIPTRRLAWTATTTFGRLKSFRSEFIVHAQNRSLHPLQRHPCECICHRVSIALLWEFPSLATSPHHTHPPECPAWALSFLGWPYANYLECAVVLISVSLCGECVLFTKSPLANHTPSRVRVRVRGMPCLGRVLVLKKKMETHPLKYDSLRVSPPSLKCLPLSSKKVIASVPSGIGTVSLCVKSFQGISSPYTRVLDAITGQGGRPWGYHWIYFYCLVLRFGLWWGFFFPLTLQVLFTTR